MNSVVRFLSRCSLGASIFAGMALLMSGCLIPGAVTGGGWIPSADLVSGDKANFGFSGQQCDLSQPPTGNFNFHDKSSGFSSGTSVKMNGTLAQAGQCVFSTCATDADCSTGGGTCGLLLPNNAIAPVCVYPDSIPSQACEFCLSEFNSPLPDKTYGLAVNYTSTNSSYPGTGAALVCMIDNGQGHNASQKDQLAITIGTGPYAGYTNSGSVQGNISGHTCP
jgi:hypothetical protein